MRQKHAVNHPSFNYHTSYSAKTATNIKTPPGFVTIAPKRFESMTGHVPRQPATQTSSTLGTDSMLAVSRHTTYRSTNPTRGRPNERSPRLQPPYNESILTCHEVQKTCLVMGPLVSLHDQLVRSSDKHQSVRLVELLRDVLWNKQTQEVNTRASHGVGKSCRPRCFVSVSHTHGTSMQLHLHPEYVYKHKHTHKTHTRHTTCMKAHRLCNHDGGIYGSTRESGSHGDSSGSNSMPLSTEASTRAF